jgi:hypothetical protein
MRRASQPRHSAAGKVAQDGRLRGVGGRLRACLAIRTGSIPRCLQLKPARDRRGGTRLYPSARTVARTFSPCRRHSRTISWRISSWEVRCVGFAARLRGRPAAVAISVGSSSQSVLSARLAQDALLRATPLASLPRVRPVGSAIWNLRPLALLLQQRLNTHCDNLLKQLDASREPFSAWQLPIIV